MSFIIEDVVSKTYFVRLASKAAETNNFSIIPNTAFLQGQEHNTRTYKQNDHCAQVLWEDYTY